MKILITGASGFVGSHLVEQALAEHHEVWAALRSSSSRRWLTDGRTRIILLDDVLGSGECFDAVIWCAGITKALREEDFETVNYRQMRQWVEALRERGRLPRVFLYMSSLSARYPKSAYGRSKLHAAEWLRQQRDFVPVILYPTGVYGPRDRDYLEQFRIVGSHLDFVPGLWGEQKLTFVYVRDLARVVMRSLQVAWESEGRPCIEMEVSEPQTYGNREFRQMLQSEFTASEGHRWRVLPLRIPIWLMYVVCWCSGMVARWRKKPALLNSDKVKMLSQRDWSADVSQMHRWLGDVSLTPLREGIRETFLWYKSQGWLK